MRQRLAQQAAQILVENGTTDYYAAKRKAALHLGAVDTRNMPSNSEIDQALREYQRIFRADTQPQQLQRLRQVAIQAMLFFTDFKPRLVGSVLDGTADVNSMVVYMCLRMLLKSWRFFCCSMRSRMNWRKPSCRATQARHGELS